MPETNPWTAFLAIIVAIAAVKIGVHNLELGLNAVGAIKTLPSNSHNHAL